MNILQAISWGHILNIEQSLVTQYYPSFIPNTVVKTMAPPLLYPSSAHFSFLLPSVAGLVLVLNIVAAFQYNLSNSVFSSITNRYPKGVRFYISTFWLRLTCKDMVNIAVNLFLIFGYYFLFSRTMPNIFSVYLNFFSLFLFRQTYWKLLLYLTTAKSEKPDCRWREKFIVKCTLKWTYVVLFVITLLSRGLVLDLCYEFWIYQEISWFYKRCTF